jgi:hypothetical protein
VVGVSTESVTAVNHSTDGDFLVLPTDISNMATGSANVQITLHIPGNTFYFSTSADPLSYYPAHVGFAELRTSQSTGNLYLYQYNQYLAVNLTGTFDSAAQKCWLNEQDVSITLPTTAANNWVFDPSAGRVINGLVFSLYNQNQPVDFQLLFKCDSDTLTNPVTFTYSGGSHEVLTVKNPLPASTSADEGKVLKVDANGDPEWSTGGGGSQVQSDWAETDTTDPSYIENKPTPKTLVAGQGIAISESSASLTVTNTVARDAVNLIAGSGVTLTQSGSDLTISSVVPTVDQTYDASSANAQSGVAVASGISAAIASAVIPISIVSALPANPDPNTLYVITGA